MMISCALRQCWLFLVITLSCAQTIAASERLALVVGNADYRVGPLKNPSNDARAMAQTLRVLGFDVMEKHDLGFDGLLDAMREFTARGRDRQVRLFYFAGHGVQIKGKNFLIPTDAIITSEADFSRRTADVQDLLDSLGRMQTGFNVVILDACRTNPFPRSLRGGKQGLNRSTPPRGTLIAYATSPGMVALDNNREANSVYTKHLVTNLNAQGLTIEQLFKKVLAGVTSDTNNQQIPWVVSSFTGDYCFNPEPGGRCGGAE